jgi:hypothetical protein
MGWVLGGVVSATRGMTAGGPFGADGEAASWRSIEPWRHTRSRRRTATSPTVPDPWHEPEPPAALLLVLMLAVVLVTVSALVIVAL